MEALTFQLRSGLRGVPETPAMTGAGISSQGSRGPSNCIASLSTGATFAESEQQLPGEELRRHTCFSPGTGGPIPDWFLPFFFYLIT